VGRFAAGASRLRRSPPQAAAKAVLDTFILKNRFQRLAGETATTTGESVAAMAGSHAKAS